MTSGASPRTGSGCWRRWRKKGHPGDLSGTARELVERLLAESYLRQRRLSAAACYVVTSCGSVVALVVFALVTWGRLLLGG